MSVPGDSPTERAQGSLAHEAWRRLRSNRAAVAALAFLLALTLLAVLAPLLPLASPSALELERATRPPAPGALFDHAWPHRVSLRFRFDEAPPTRGALVQTEQTLLALARPLTGETGRVLRRGRAESVTELELAYAYRPELDPVHGSDLEQRARAELASQSTNGRLHLRGGGEAAVSLVGLSAQDAYGGLGTFDGWLVSLRHRLFGFLQLSPWLGTDTKGRDLLARCVFGSRISLLVGLAGAIVSVLVGITYGALSGYFGGRVDERMMRLVDVLYSVPFLFVVIFVITLIEEYEKELSAFGFGRLTAFFLVLGLVTWLTMARVVRGQVLSLKNQEFVLAARVLGASHGRILLVHILPHLAGVVAVYLTLTLPSVMLYEAFLSFLGLGVVPPQVSWGLLAADAMDALNPIAGSWWLVLGPALFLGSTLLALNVLGDGLRDALDTRTRVDR